MRLIGTLPNRKLAQEFSYFLIKEGIENVIEPAGGEGDAESSSFHIWIIDENDVDKASSQLKEFLASPTDERFFGHWGHAKKVDEARREQLREQMIADERVARPLGARGRLHFGLVTIGLCLIAALCYIFGGLDFILTDEAAGESKEPSRVIVVTKPIYAKLLYDFPKSFFLFDKLATHFTPEELSHPSSLPQEAQATLEEAFDTPVWGGAYLELLRRIHAPVPDWTTRAPLFEKIRQGEVWRIFTPCLLHADIFHIIFNLLWLIVVFY